MDGTAGPPPAPGSIPPQDQGRNIRRINLALQGGGTHGAFTWGVLERLLEEGSIEVAAVSGTSAGAINAAMLAQGLAENGRRGAIASLDRFWRNVAAKLAFNPLRSSPLEKAIWGHDLTYSLAWQTFDTLTRVLSPYQFDLLPAAFNPLRRALEETLDVERVQFDPGAPALFVSATNVRTGKPRVFSRNELSVDALLASTCLPNIAKAVEIDGEAYWDGGYVGNPAIWPLYDGGGPPDIVLVQINPLVRPDVPRTTSDILTRLHEIGFNASLAYEMRAIEFVQRLVDSGTLREPRYTRLFVHLIEDEERMRQFGMSTKYNGDWDFLVTLKGYGREAADRWLREHGSKLGRADSVNLRARFL